MVYFNVLNFIFFNISFSCRRSVEFCNTLRREKQQQQQKKTNKKGLPIIIPTQKFKVQFDFQRIFNLLIVY